MRAIFSITFLFILPLMSKSQSVETRSLSNVCKQVSMQWKLDSNSCKGYRLKVVELITKAKVDSISKSFLFSTLGNPNRIQKYSVGYPINKKYVEYIYYIYMDNCPKMKVEAAAIGFVFDESETYFVRIEDHDYCG